MKKGIDYIGVITPFFCHDGKGNFLFYKRGDASKDEQGKWDCSGGTLNFGEQPFDGALRKLKSQYSVEPMSYEQLPACSILIDINHQPTHWLAVPFIFQVDRIQVKIGEPEKMNEIGWFTLKSLPTPLHPGAAFVLHLHKDLFNKFA
jgi:8-oxo-dGTP diphosphatase